ncbi:hypothetical protein Tco_0738915, partial [Tanacetum coccineum]
LLLVYFNTAANGIDVWFLVKRRISRHQHALIDKETTVEIFVLLDLKGRISTAGYELILLALSLKVIDATYVFTTVTNTFMAMGSEVQERKENKEEGREETTNGSRKKIFRRKRARKEQQKESSKKQKVKEEKESEEVDEIDKVELKKLMVIKKDE